MDQAAHRIPSRPVPEFTSLSTWHAAPAGEDGYTITLTLTDAAEYEAWCKWLTGESQDSE